MWDREGDREQELLLADDERWPQIEQINPIVQPPGSIENWLVSSDKLYWLNRVINI
jgi:hypothetical protein